MPASASHADHTRVFGELEGDVSLPGQVRTLEEDLRLWNQESALSHRRAERIATPIVTVVTVTRGNPHLLEHAVESVRSQDYAGAIEHLIVVDDDDDVVAYLNRASTCHSRERAMSVILERRPRGEDPAAVYPRLARLLNCGVRAAKSPWVSFLDDDNRFAPNHISSLIECALRSRSPAVHSGRTIHWRDGAPYLEPLFPHAASEEEARRLYRLMCDRGVWLRGTNVLLDRADANQTSYRNSTVMADDDPVLLVDQNVWLIRREILCALPIPADFSAADIAAGTAPDDKLIETLLRHGVPIARTDRPTVQYFLGGISNPHNRRSGTSR